MTQNNKTFSNYITYIHGGCLIRNRNPSYKNAQPFSSSLPLVVCRTHVLLPLFMFVCT